MIAKTDHRAATHGDLVLVLNCGSSSIKFALFHAEFAQHKRAPFWAGKVDGIKVSLLDAQREIDIRRRPRRSP